MPGRGPHPREHRRRGEARHRVDLVDDQRAVGDQEEVDPGEPLARRAPRRRATASARSSVGDVVAEVGGDVELGVLVGEVLRLEVVELVVAADRGSPRARSSPAAPSSACEHAALDLARALGRDCSTSTLGSWRRASSMRGVELGGVVHLADPDARAGAGRLDERPGSRAPRPAARTPSGPAPTRARGHGDAGQHRQPGGREHDLHVGLVHADRGRRAPRRRRSGRRPSRASPGGCRPRPTGRAAAGRPRRPRRASAAAAPARHDEVGAAGVARQRDRGDRSPSTCGSVVAGDREPARARRTPAPSGRRGRCRPAPRRTSSRSIAREHAARGDARDARARWTGRRRRRRRGACGRASGVASERGCGSSGWRRRPTLPRLRCAAMTRRLRAPARHDRRHGRPAAARARPAAEHADHDGVDVRRRRRRWSTAATATPPGRRSRRRSAPSRAVAAWPSRPGSRRSPPCSTWSAGARGRRAAARLQRHRHAARRPRGARPGHGRARRHHRHRRGRRGLRRRRARLARVADQPGARGRRHRRRSRRPRTTPAPTSSSTTPSPRPCCSARSSTTPTSSCTRRRSTSPATPTC